ncbi:helix-turn-helix domain-containing protein [Streptomyces iranensis]|uniref:Transcriptional regulator, CdaR n=1 Tax=Streptomyces iranensis TaxID=576784 RepID=A0A061A7R6_9ACTN|nr:helix-turn-helix domain-containing protein [Streptomyces iranensis]MBP2066156.1 hypothetical protein [Streptomyces iranensis]CDR13187.1 transcriptional regulator, CdaR [Streptomyces iranensis]
MVTTPAHGSAPSLDTVAGLLDALASDARGHEVEGLADALVSRVSPEGAERVRASTRRLREVLDRRLRRERELIALYGTACDLAQIRDVGTALDSIVRRAHDVVPSADAVYLCLRSDSSDGFYVKASVGLTSPAFMHVEVPSGCGMSSVIERTRAPLQIQRYNRSTGFRHDSELDRALADDGLVSVLGTPFMLRGEVMGILFAANRIERVFSKEEISLLTAFADHAAVALHNARLFAGLEEEHRAVANHVTAMKRSAQLHDSLTDLVISGADVTDVADALADVFAEDLLLVGKNNEVTSVRGRPVTAGEECEHAHAQYGRAVPSEIAEDIMASQRSGHCVVNKATRCARYVAAIPSGHTYLGALVLHTTHGLTDLDVRTLERAAQIVALLTLREQAIGDAEERVRGELLEELLSRPKPLRESTKLFAHSRHFDVARPHVVVAAALPDSPRSEARQAVRETALAEGGLGGEYNRSLVAVLPGDDPGATAVRVRRRLSAATDGPVLVCAADAADPRTGDLAAQAPVAVRCLQLLQALGRRGAAATTRDFALYSLLLDPQRDTQLKTFLGSTLGKLQAYDQEHGSDLIRTLTVFFATGSSAAQTARELYVHPNTVIKRLDRVGSLLGSDWQAEPRALQLRIALHLHDLFGKICELEDR